VWAAFLKGQESPGTRAPTAREARAILCNHAPEPFASVNWENFARHGWRIARVTAVKVLPSTLAKIRLAAEATGSQGKAVDEAFARHPEP
jgi:hypothetical protein